jgi:RHS repeat-associated protein
LRRIFPFFLTLWIFLFVGIFQLGAVTCYHFDQVGSTIARTDDTGNVIGRAAYSAYGLNTFSEGDMATPFRYNGQAGVITEKNGLLFMRARYYSPYLMRFLNADPSGFSGGPNWYSYADGNPVSLSDPFGLCPDRNLCTGGTGRGSPYASNEVRKLWMATEMALGFTPLGVVMDIGNMGQAGYNDDMAGVAMGAVGFLPFGDFAKLGKVAKYEDEMVDVYRGIHGGHPDLPNAYNGQANPIGGHSDPARHNEMFNDSEFTSWTTDRNVAVDFATRWGDGGGVLLEQSVPRSSLIKSPDVYRESEVLRLGPVSGATPTILQR